MERWEQNENADGGQPFKYSYEYCLETSQVFDRKVEIRDSIHMFQVKIIFRLFCLIRPKQKFLALMSAPINSKELFLYW